MTNKEMRLLLDGLVSHCRRAEDFVVGYEEARGKPFPFEVCNFSDDDLPPGSDERRAHRAALYLGQANFAEGIRKIIEEHAREGLRGTHMEVERTLAIIKPDAVAAGHAGRIVSLLAREAFRIVDGMETRLTAWDAGELYAGHRGKPFFGELVRFMASGRVIALVLERWQAIALLRAAAGATDPAEAAPGTVRAMFGTAMPANAMHASDSPLSAEREIRLFFGPPLRSPEVMDLWDGCDEPVPAAEIAGAMASEERSE